MFYVNLTHIVRHITVPYSNVDSWRMNEKKSSSSFFNLLAWKKKTMLCVQGENANFFLPSHLQKFIYSNVFTYSFIIKAYSNYIFRVFSFQLCSIWLGRRTGCILYYVLYKCVSGGNNEKKKGCWEGNQW